MKTVVALAGLLFAAPAAGMAQAPDAPMALYGVIAGPAGVTFRAPMSACAARADYTVAVLERAPRPMLLLSPRRAGQCAPAGSGHIDLVYGFEDLGLKAGQPFVLGNPIVSEP